MIILAIVCNRRNDLSSPLHNTELASFGTMRYVSYSHVMFDEQARVTLEQQQWTCVTENVNLVSPEAPFVELWKQYINGVAVTLSIHYEEGLFVLYEDVGHAASGTKRTNCGTFPSANAAVHHLIQACYSWDDTWGME